MGARSFLDPLPPGVQADVGFWVFDAEGRVVEHAGFDDGFGDLDAVEPDRVERAAARRALNDGCTVVFTFPRSEREAWAPFLEALVSLDVERRELEGDIESMSASSLALLEEAAMVGELMTELSMGETEGEIVARGLDSLLVGTAAERVAYFRFDGERDVFEVVAQVVYDESERRGIVTEYTADPCVPAEGLLARAANASASGVLVDVRQDAPAEGSPESLAHGEVLAMPVFFGEESRTRLLGVIVLFDKRATSYSSVTRFGSHESKLANGLASMLAAVLGARKTAELGKELKMATMIQQQILPDRPAAVDAFDLAGRCETSGAVGGDYFDFLRMSDGRTLCVVADVSGHNLASGMVMVSARSALRVLTAQESHVPTVFDELARALFTDLNRTERFITAAGVAIRPGDGRVELANAGHNDTMVYRHASGAIERIESADTIFGFVPNVSYDSCTVDLAPGDVVVLYTDGVTETTSSDREMFGEERLADVIRNAGSRPAHEILDSIYESVHEFADEPGGDDITAVVVRYVGREDAENE